MKKLIKALKIAKNLALTLLIKGKAFWAWILLEIPNFSQYPGFMTAWNAVIKDPSKENVYNFLLQAAFVILATQGAVAAVKEVKLKHKKKTLAK